MCAWGDAVEQSLCQGPCILFGNKQDAGIKRDCLSLTMSACGKSTMLTTLDIVWSLAIICRVCLKRVAVTCACASRACCNDSCLSQMTEMKPIEVEGKQRLTFIAPSRGLIGFRYQYHHLTASSWEPQQMSAALYTVVVMMIICAVQYIISAVYMHLRPLMHMRCCCMPHSSRGKHK